MAVKDGSGPQPAAHSAKRCFLNCLETSFKPCFFLPWLCLLTFILHSSGTQPWVCLPTFILHSSGQRTPSQGQNTMAVKDGSGPQPAAHSAKRCLLNCLETSFKPCFFLPWLCLLTFILHSSGPRTPSQGQNTMAVKDGSGPRPAAHSAKRCFLNCLETSFKPCFFLPWLCLLTFILHSSGPRTPSQRQNTMAVKDGLGPQPAAHSAKRCFLNCLETSFKLCFFLPWLCLLTFILHSSGPRTHSSCQLACVLLQLAFVLSELPRN